MTLSENSLLIVLSEERLRSIVFDAVKLALSEIPQPKTTGFDENEMLTRKAASKLLMVCVSTIDNYRNRGLIIPLRLGNTIRYRREDLMKAFSSSLSKSRKNRTIMA